MKFKANTADINRFNGRIRVAHSFEGIKLRDYADDTILGYDALLQVFLTHSALECFIPIIGVKKVYKLNPIIESYHQDDLLQYIRDHDPKDRFFQFIYDRVNKNLQGHLDNFFSGEMTNVGNLSAAIRHIFVHGELTATGNGVNPKNVHCICSSLSDFLLKFMDEEFSRRVEDYHDRISKDDLQNLST